MRKNLPEHQGRQNYFDAIFSGVFVREKVIVEGCKYFSSLQKITPTVGYNGLKPCNYMCVDDSFQMDHFHLLMALVCF